MNARLRRPAVALITTALAASVLGIVPAASAAPMGLLSGSVSSGGLPASGVEVTVYEYDAEGGYWGYSDDTSTGGNGAYSLELPEGEYRLGFQDFDGRYVEEFYDNAPDLEAPQAVTLTVDDARPVVADADLQAAAHIIGTVLGTGAAPVEDIRVTAYQRVVENPGTPDEYVDYWYAGRGYTDELGRYDVGGLSDGTFRIAFEDTRVYQDAEYATEYYDDAPSLRGGATKDVVVPSAGLVEDIDAELELDSEITGTVTGAGEDGTGPLVDAEVDVLTKVGNRWEYVGYAETNETGDYRVDGLPAGTYRVGFGGDVLGGYAREFWKNVRLLGNATDVIVGDDVTVGAIDAQLVVGEHNSETGEKFVSTAPPTISGAAVVGQTLTATAGSWTTSDSSSVQPTDFTYAWFRGDDYVYDVYGPTYVLTSIDVGLPITVRVYADYERSEYDIGEGVSAPTAPVSATAPVVTPPVVAPPVVTPPVVTPPTPVVDVPAALAKALAAAKVAGRAKVGSTVKVKGLATPSGTAVSYTYTWFAGTKAIKKATKATLKITRAMKGKKLSVKVTGKSGSTSRSVKLKVGKIR